MIFTAQKRNLSTPTGSDVWLVDSGRTLKEQSFFTRIYCLIQCKHDFLSGNEGQEVMVLFKKQLAETETSPRKSPILYYFTHSMTSRVRNGITNTSIERQNITDICKPIAGTVISKICKPIAGTVISKICKPIAGTVISKICKPIAGTVISKICKPIAGTVISKIRTWI